MPGSPRPPGWTSTSATPIRPGSAAPTRTPTGSCASTSPKAPTCPAGDPATSTRSPPNSTIAPANASTGPRLPKPSTNYYPNKQIHPVLQPPRESAAIPAKLAGTTQGSVRFERSNQMLGDLRVAGHRGMDQVSAVVFGDPPGGVDVHELRIVEGL